MVALHGLGNNRIFLSSASTSSQRFEEAHFTFALTPQQVQQILTSRYVSFSPPASSLGTYLSCSLTSLSLLLSPLCILLSLLSLSFFYLISPLYPLDIYLSIHPNPLRAIY